MHVLAWVYVKRWKSVVDADVFSVVPFIRWQLREGKPPTDVSGDYITESWKGIPPWWPMHGIQESVYKSGQE